ncbi:D-alanine--D-alanine ligase-like [Lineus longissimus]|uniref:D-alanine--D-alanine ligase-like n=1 Tax=Lineus longissimus TaxID=88925 RepID=UPI00315C5408
MRLEATKPLEVIVLKGGISLERNISLASGGAVAEALRKSGHQVREIDIVEGCLPNDMGTADVVFPVLHGDFGEDGKLQALLDEAGYKYVGTGAQASAVTIDKYETVCLLRNKGIDVAASQVLKSVDQALSTIHKFPVIVKPNSQGSSFGMSIVEEEAELGVAIRKAFTADEKVLVEEFICGSETSVGLLFGKALPVVEIVTPEGFYDYDAKYVFSKGKTIYNCPPQNIPRFVQERMQAIAETCYTVTGARDLLRVDMIWQQESDRIVVLEVNTMPGFTSSSLLPKSAAQVNVGFNELCHKLAVAAFKRS